MTEEKESRFLNRDSFTVFCCGGIAGCFAKTTVAPFDRVKVLLQGHNKHYTHLTALQALKKVYKYEGFVGGYRGNGAQMVRIFPYSAVQFVSYGEYKKLSQELDLVHDGGYEKLVCGAFAGMTAASITYPLDVIRSRLAFQVTRNVPSSTSVELLTAPGTYRGIGDAFVQIVRQEGGVVGLYRGLSATLIGMAPYAGISFYSFEWLKDFVLKRYHSQSTFLISEQSSDGDDEPVKILSIPGKLLCGGMAGMIAQTAAYPLDVTRRIMQLSRGNGLRESWTIVLYRVFKEYGIINGLYRGMTLNYLRVVPMVSVSFTVYETLTAWTGTQKYAST